MQRNLRLKTILIVHITGHKTDICCKQCNNEARKLFNSCPNDSKLRQFTCRYVKFEDIKIMTKWEVGHFNVISVFLCANLDQSRMGYGKINCVQITEICQKCTCFAFVSAESPFLSHRHGIETIKCQDSAILTEILIYIGLPCVYFNILVAIFD